MIKNFSNSCHILKAKIIVAYALFFVFTQCSNISRHKAIRTLVKDILYFIRHPFTYLRKGLKARKNSVAVYTNIGEMYDILYKNFFNEYTEHRKTDLADYAYVNIECPALGSYFARIIGVAWFCEKLGINVKFVFPDTYVIGSSDFFRNSILCYSKTCRAEKFKRLKKPLLELDYWKELTRPSIWEEFAKYKISSEYGHDIISKLSIKQELLQQAERWRHANIKQPCIGVHYRLSDNFDENRAINMENYIVYLKQVLDDRYNIFACSDNTRFIAQMYKAFPDRVVARDITRSDDNRSLHRHQPYAGNQQRQDALIDMLVLAKTEIIYTIGSFMIDVTRFFNPRIKIISIDGRCPWYKYIPNYVPVPQAHLLNEIQKGTSWKKPLFDRGKVKHIEFIKR